MLYMFIKDWPVLSCLCNCDQSLCPWCTLVVDVCMVGKSLSRARCSLLLSRSSVCATIGMCCLCSLSVSSSPAEDLLASQLTSPLSLSLKTYQFISCQSVLHLLRPLTLLVLTRSYEGWSETNSQPLYSACMCFFFVVLIQLLIKVLWDNASSAVCLWFLRDTTAPALLIRTGSGCRKIKPGPLAHLTFCMLYITHVGMKRSIWNRPDTAAVWSNTRAGSMNGFYSMRPEEPEKETKVNESFKFVSEEKRDMWRDDGGAQTVPSCCLSVNKISYTVR